MGIVTHAYVFSLFSIVLKLNWSWWLKHFEISQIIPVTAIITINLFRSNWDGAIKMTTFFNWIIESSQRLSQADPPIFAHLILQMTICTYIIMFCLLNWHFPLSIEFVKWVKTKMQFDNPIFTVRCVMQ